jgi:hypothetical protein
MLMDTLLMDEKIEELALEISADAPRAHLERCLAQIRENQAALADAQARMDAALYDLLRSREHTEALAEENRALEARVHLLLGALRPGSEE